MLPVAEELAAAASLHHRSRSSLALEAPRVLVNVENDDYGDLRRDVACDCPPYLGAFDTEGRH